MVLEGARILVIDDHADLSQNLAEILEGEGATVHCAGTAAEGRALAAEPFDVALLDMGLPDAEGLSLLPELGGAGDGLGEVLLITGNASLETAIAALAGGAYAYLLKPFDPNDLLRQVERALRQVRATREAERLRRTLERSEADLSTLVDTVQALLLVLDEEGRIVQANHAVAAATGVPVGALLGEPWVERFVPGADQAGVRDALARLVAGASPISHENRVLHAGEDGETTRWVSWRASARRLPDGRLRIYKSGLDITEMHALERRTRLAEKLAAVGTLSAGLAHEIRNPLNAASLQLRLLERRVKDLADQGAVAQPIAVVQEELERLSNLVVDFLSFARPSELHTSEIDLRDLARRVVDLEAPGATERDVDLGTELPGAPTTVLGDADKLQQVLLNLVRNAIEAVGKGGRVRVRVARDGSDAVLSVVDDGPGIPLEEQSRIFEPFFSTKPGGTGLGMAIVHSLVSLHGGEVTVVSEQGTEIRIRLPRRAPAAPAPR